MFGVTARALMDFLLEVNDGLIKNDPEDVSWCSISKDNITTWYGETEDSRIFDPKDRTKIISGLICEITC